ncbi:MAG TPA: outer membrane beta-barrel protein [Alloacidobacterium sp.]|nr:outer membrane beta-barrel protein [Alloacidobacterium sp.]
MQTRRMLKSGRQFLAVAAFLLAGAALWAQSAPANQITSESHSDTAGGITAVKVAPSTDAILKELDAMRARIAELEAQLKAQSGVQNNTMAVDAAAQLQASRQALLASGAPAATEALSSPSIASVRAAEPALASTTTTTTTPTIDKMTPFADADWTWLNGNPRTKDFPLATKYFTPEIRVDTNYNLDLNHPADDTINGSSEIFRAQEVQLEQFGVGGDLLVDHVHARLMTQFGMYSVTTPRNDASVGRGQWQLNNAYRYLAEAYGGYHWDKMHGINLDAGIFMSYIGLFSYYNFDNWAYQPSFVSSNTPWFFNGVRGQFFVTQHLKIEPWFINGWQSYARFNTKPGLGGQIKWTPNNFINVISNNYGYGEDDLNIHGRTRFHTDDSVEVKYYDHPDNVLDKMAFSLTGDAGCESGSGVACTGSANHKILTPATPTSPAVYYSKQSFLGWMAYDRTWFNKDRYALTIGGGRINNPGRYLVLVPAINGATALTGTAYFPENPGQPYHGTDGTITWDFMPRQYITFRTEYGYRHSDVPYWAGRGGSTPPGGSQNSSIGSPGDFTCTNGSNSVDSGIGYSSMPGLSYKQEYAANIAAAKVVCAGIPGYTTLWQPDLRRDEQKLTFAIMVKF